MKCFILALASLLLLRDTEPAPRVNVARTVERFENLSVGSEAFTVNDLRLTSSHLDCRLVSGRAAPVRAGEDVVGLFFEGRGSMEYVSADPVEAPVVLF